MKKRIMSAISLCLAAVLFISTGQLNAEYKFREFYSDREKFEGYSDNAEKSITEQDWQNILDSGKQVMQADWERSAAAEMERYIRQGGDQSEIKLSIEESRAAWESEFEKAESYAKGSWFLKRENLVFESIDFSSLKKSVLDAGNDKSITSAGEWDSYINSSLAGVNLSWDIKFIPLLENIKSKGDILTGDARKGFEDELAVFEKGLRKSFEVERNIIVYTGRNAFITELYIDNESLKYQSAQESADASTGNIIKEVQESLKSEEDKILTKSYNSEGVSTVDLSGMGDNWQEELKQLVNTGMEKWNGALDRLYQQMLTWKQDAAQAYETAETLWRDALKRLQDAKTAWENKISKEINEALNKWQKEEGDLNNNIEMARADFDSYMKNLSSQWSDHTGGLMNMAIDGSKIYAESLDNIKWLVDMCGEKINKDTGAFGVKGISQDANDNFMSILDLSEKERIDSSNVIYGIDSLIQRYGVSYNQHKIGKQNVMTCYDLFGDSNCVSNPINGYLNHYYLDNIRYNYQYTGYTERKDENGEWIITENYLVTVHARKMTYQADSKSGIGSSTTKIYQWIPSEVVSDSFTITNDIKSGSPDSHKSSYYYYKTELERWKNIRESFSGIAKDAEIYMHQKNMLGTEGPGYLTNADGEYQPNGIDNAGDPYLMTEAELQLELELRNKEYWQKRLDIAKEVLVYSEKIKKESADETEAKRDSAKDDKEKAKQLYDDKLKEVEGIVAKLKTIQGKKPSASRNDSNKTEWDAYLESIEYLTVKFKEANNLLKEADSDYLACKGALILHENGEDSGYLLDEIQNIEKNLIKADRDLNLKRVEFFKAQMESDYNERTSGFAEKYESAVKNFEDSKMRFNEIQGVLAGEENDDSLFAWAMGITAKKDIIWKESAAEYSAKLQKLADDFKTAEGYEKELLRSDLSGAIRYIYFGLQGEMKKDELIVNTLRDRNFDPDAYLSENYKGDRAAWGRSAEISVKALELVEDAFDSADEQSMNYDTIFAWLTEKFGNQRYIYGADNSSYVIHYTALKYFESRYRGLTPETWESSRDRLERDLESSENAADFNERISSSDDEDIADLISDLKAELSGGYNDESVALLREYYMSGSSISGIEFIEEFDKNPVILQRSNIALKNYISDNYRYFLKGQNMLRNHGYLNDMLGYLGIVSAVFEPGNNPLTVEAFKNFTAEDLSEIAGSMRGFFEKLEVSNYPVPEFLKSAAQMIEKLKDKFDSELFIERYMSLDKSDEMAGTVDDVYDRKLAESEKNRKISEFIQSCEDIIKSGIGDDYQLSLTILARYETLSVDEKLFLSGNENEKIRGVDTFIRNLYLQRYIVNIENLAARYETQGYTMEPAQYASMTDLNADDRVKLVKKIETVYERELFDSGIREGAISDIEEYISSRDLDREPERKLRGYAMINEFLKSASEGNSTSTDPGFKEYVKFKKFEDFFIKSIQAGDENDQQYAERCVSEFLEANVQSIEESDKLIEFAMDYIEKDLTAFNYLPVDVQIFEASKYYYEEMFCRNRVPSEGIELFLKGRFGTESIDSDVTEAVEKYAGRLSTVSFYYGEDPDKFTEDMDDDAKRYFLMYINEESDAILPGFEYGIYEKSEASAGLLVELGGITTLLDNYYSGFTELHKAQEENCFAADKVLKNAIALKDFYNTGVSYGAWRGGILAISEGDMLLTSSPVTDFTGWYDSYNSEGFKDNISYSDLVLNRDGKKFYSNGIIENMNSIVSLFTALGEVMRQGLSPDSETGILSFLDDAGQVYQPEESYTSDNGIIELEGVVSKFSALSELSASKAFMLSREINVMESGSESGKKALVTKKKSYDIIGGGADKQALLNKLEMSRIAQEKVKNEVENYSDLLAGARKKYETANSVYVETMNFVSKTYSSYQEYEFNYEKAYSVWEYANTPYIKDSVNDTGNIVSGEAPEGGVADYSKIPVPDAKENYRRILKEYNKAEADYAAKAAVVTNQDTIEKLNNDSEYAERKADLVRKYQSYIRISQADAQLGETLGKLEIDHKSSKDDFNLSREEVKFFSDMLEGKSDEEKAELGRKRDLILSHIAKHGVEKYMEAMEWYSSWRAIVSGAEGDNFEGNISYAINYNTLPPEIKSDMELLNAHFRDTGILLNPEDGELLGVPQKKMTSIGYLFDNYSMFRYLENKTEDARRKWRGTSKLKYFTRRERERVYDERRNERDNFYSSYYYSGSVPIKATLDDYIIKRADFIEKDKLLNGIVSVKDLEALKSYIGGESRYNLSDEDLKYFYESISGGTAIDEGIDISLLRKKVQRLDIDGEPVKVRYRNKEVFVLAKDDTELTGDENIYKISNPGIKLYLDGEEAVSFVENGIYYLYDLNFNIKKVTEVMKSMTEEITDEYYADLMDFVVKSAEEGKHDYTVMLRDLELTFHGLQQYAVAFNYKETVTDDGNSGDGGNAWSHHGGSWKIGFGINSTETVPESEKRQRSFDGYIKVTEDYINNGKGTSIQDLIVREMMSQSLKFQEQLWAQQKEKFKERKSRWNEVAGYIFNRGVKEWRENYGEFQNLLKKWRFDAKKMITDGEEWWAGVNREMTGEMNRWTEETSKASSKEAAEQIYSSLDGVISSYEADLKKKMPGKTGFDIDMDKIFNQSMKNRPLDSIGILSQTMLSTDTTAGFADILNMGLSGSLMQHNEKQMEEYINAMGVMQNLQVLDILNGIIDNFNEQLEKQNGKIYDAFGGFATGKDIISAPFVRKKEQNQWSIRVCTSSTLLGDKYKTRTFTDYSYYKNSTVYLMTINGLNGTTIDFTQANTYANLDGDELDVYVGLEAEKLSREIEKVFKNPDETKGEDGGLLSMHINSEQERIGADFGKYYEEWYKGEMMRGMAGWNKPIANGAPSIAVSINIGAQIAGYCLAGTAGAAIGQFAAAALTTGLDMADGQLTWKQGGAQIGSGLVTRGSGIFAPVVSGALQGIDYEDGGGVGWDYDMFKDGLRSGVKEMGVRAVVGNIPGLSDVAASWVDTDGGWGDWGFNNGNWGDHIIAGFGGAIGAAGLPGQSGQLITEIIRSSAYNIGGGNGFEEVEGVDGGMFNWNLFSPKASDIGALLPQMAGYAMNGMPAGKGEGSQPDTSDPFQQAETMLGGWWQSIKEGYGEGGINGGFGAMAGAVTGYAGFVGAGIANGYNEAKKSWSIMGAIGGFDLMDTVIDGVKSGWSWLTEAVGGLFEKNTQSASPQTSPNASETEKALSSLELKRKLMEKAHGGSDKEQELAEKLLDYMEKIEAREKENKDNPKKGEWFSVFESTEEVMEYIQTKKLLGEPLDAEDARMLAQTMKQRDKNGQFGKEFADYIKNNTEKFKAFKISGLDLNDDKSIIKFANNFSKSACFINTIFMNIILSPITDGIPQSFGDMYVKAQESNLIKEDGISSTQYMNTEKGVQAWIDGIVGKGKLDVEGYFKGFDTKSSDMLQKIQILANQGVLASGGRFHNNGHSMMQALTNGIWGIYDTGKPSYNYTRPVGDSYINWYDSSDTNSFWILKPIIR